MCKPQLKVGFYRPHRRDATWFVDETPSMTKQSFVEECDINNILAQYKLTGQIAHMSAKAESGVYQDLPDQIDFQESMNTVIQAEAAFASLPSQIRSRFHNDPAEFLGFVADPANQDEIIKLGLAKDTRPEKPPASPAPLPVKEEPESPLERRVPKSGV